MEGKEGRTMKGGPGKEDKEGRTRRGERVCKRVRTLDAPDKAIL